MYYEDYDGVETYIMAKNKRTLLPFIIGLTLLALFIGTVTALIDGVDLALLNPKGQIAEEQTWLLVTSTLIMLGFGVPVILTLYFFVWKYRDGNQKAVYDPKTTNSKAFLAFAWGGPLIIVTILAYFMLPATQRLEPQKAIASDKDQLTVQVVALNWKWLFIYPEQNVATINYVQIPVDTPVRFELTADESPMGSFWIPHLAGMLYTMTGHVNPLNLIAHTPGDYEGGAAEINGAGFAGMRFTTRVSSQEDFDTWVQETQNSPQMLDSETYKDLLKPSEFNKPTFYSNPDTDLFSGIVSKYNSGHGYHHGGGHEE
jgi:cytochrome o ubiquinol oxidase subunit 2